jgi:transposase
MVVVDGQGLPLGIHVTSASPGEVTLVAPTLKTIRVPGTPRRRGRLKTLSTLVADMAYDSDPERERLAAQGIRLIAPYRSNCVHRRYEDHRRLRRYRRRWVVERTIAWFGGFRRLLMRYERFTSMYRSFLYFAAALIALRRF